jgi:alpha(1,3/1,4) fucosyltransferase
MRPLRIACSDFAASTTLNEWAALRLLAATRPIEFSDFGSADLLLYSDFGERHWGFKGLKVYMTGENMLPNFEQCDLAFTPLEVPGDPRAIRLPYYAQVLPALGSLVRPFGQPPLSYSRREKFCSFVASNPRGPERNTFFRKLNRRAPVDSAGRHFNNTRTRLLDKQSFLPGYRMNLAFENSRSPGYITEKLVEPLLAGCIPIYWGAPDVARDFNPRCMINVADFPDFDAAVNYILTVDRDEAASQAILAEPAFRDNLPPACLAPAFMADPIARLIDSGLAPGKRSYRHRRLREHTYASPLHQSITSLKCRLDGLAWKMGLRF